MSTSPDYPLHAALHARCTPPATLPFSAFMAAALYDPAHGYYASGHARIGRTGDFFTSVSVGPLFGTLLALRIATWWRDHGRPDRWQLIEQGANDGQLMSDILCALPPDITPPSTVVLIEPTAETRCRQRDTLAPLPVAIEWRGSLAPPAPPRLPGVFVCNELLDALPFERVIWQDGRWHALCVTSTGNNFLWLRQPLPAAWQDWLPVDATALPDGYTTEIRPQLAPWARDLASALPCGLALLIDYGFEAEDYFHPSRSNGTLRTYSGHRALDDPFTAIGTSDITAHVNWSETTAALRHAGFSVQRPIAQGRWLTRIASPWLLAREASPDGDLPKQLRQFQSLTHPQHLGGKFQVIEACTASHRDATP